MCAHVDNRFCLLLTAAFTQTSLSIIHNDPNFDCVNRFL